jgi:taurine dioxygenase
MKFSQLHGEFGVEVFGFDVLQSVDRDDIDELRGALDRHQLLLFRGGQRIPPARQVEITSWFGPCLDNGNGACTVLDNENENGSRRLPFHQDFSYTAAPIKIISLQAIEIPPCGTSTAFVSGISAWATLPSDRRNLLSSMTLRHFHNSVSMDSDERTEFIADHPIRMVHPRTARPVLFVTEHHAQRIHEVGPTESNRMLADLYAHLYASDHQYLHQWRLFDLLIWDNLALQHARPEASDPAQGSRVMQRVAVGDVPYPELVRRARQR